MRDGISLKTPKEIDDIREGGVILSRILGELISLSKPGVMTGDLDLLAEKRMLEVGGKPAFKGYKPDRSVPAFNSTVCISIDDEVVHGPAHPSREVKEGSLLKLDIGMVYKGMYTDMAVTVPVGKVSPEALKLIAVTKESMLQGIAKAREGAWISEIGKTVDKIARRNGYTTVKDLTGHGVGHAVHEDPRVPNYFDRELDPVKMERGLVIAVEPMINAGREDVRVKRDRWTIVTDDGSLSAHFEVTIAISEKGMEIMTPVPEGV